MDASTAEKEGFAVGDTVTVAAGGPKRPFKLVGLATLGQSAGLGGATFVVFDLASAQALFDKRTRVDFAFARSPRSCRRPRRSGPPRRRPTRPATTSARACRS